MHESRRQLTEALPNKTEDPKKQKLKT